MKYLFLSLLFLISTTRAESKKPDLSFYSQVFKNVASVKSLKIDDPISDNPINLKVYELYSKKNKRLGYCREVVTSTGCNDGCLPVIFTLFYDDEKKFKKILSRPGLTKKFHKPFTAEDYSTLEMILLRNPSQFKQVNHPKDMVDVLTSATKPEFQPHVVTQAAYTSLRVNLYNQHTLKFLKSLK